MSKAYSFCLSNKEADNNWPPGLKLKELSFPNQDIASEEVIDLKLKGFVWLILGHVYKLPDVYYKNFS